jgi:hypothetical protein
LKTKTPKRKPTAAATPSSSDDPEETGDPANQETSCDCAADDEKGVTSEANGTLQICIIYIYMFYLSLIWIMTVADIDETSKSLYKHDCFFPHPFLFSICLYNNIGAG